MIALILEISDTQSRRIKVISFKQQVIIKIRVILLMQHPTQSLSIQILTIIQNSKCLSKVFPSNFKTKTGKQLEPCATKLKNQSAPKVQTIKAKVFQVDVFLKVMITTLIVTLANQ